MARIYKRTDRIAVKIDDIVVKLAPLSLDQKTEIQQAMIHGKVKGDLKELTKGIALSIRYAVKSIEGVQDSDGNPYKVEVDSNGDLTKECVDDLMNLELTAKLSMVCASMVNGIPSEFKDNDGIPMSGVEVVKQVQVETEKKS